MGMRDRVTFFNGFREDAENRRTGLSRRTNVDRHAGDARRAVLAQGYAGWAAGQLENEIQENGWLHCSADPELIFGRDTEGKYGKALRKIGIDPGMLSSESGHA